MSDRRERSHPPSAPPSVRRGVIVPDERHARLPMLAGCSLGLVLVALGLYVWRRPRGIDAADPGDASPTGSEAAVTGPAPSAAADAVAPSPVVVSDGRVLGCHDRGRKKTAPDECDHLTPVEKALTAAIDQAAACVPPSGSPDNSSLSGRTIEYVVDVSFARHKLSLSLPRAGRSVNDRKVLRACAAAVRVALRPLALQGIDHQHARYQISVTATYRGSPTGT